MNYLVVHISVDCKLKKRLICRWKYRISGALYADRAYSIAWHTQCSISVQLIFKLTRNERTVDVEAGGRK